MPIGQFLALPQQTQPNPLAPAGNYLGRLSGAPDMSAQLPSMQPITEALAANALKPRPAPAVPAYKPPSAIHNLLGMIGDALLVGSGHEPIYAPRMQRKRVGAMLNNYLGNSDAMLAELYQLNPELAAQAQQLHRENDFRSAASDMLLGNGGTPQGGQDGSAPAGPSAYERASRADPEKFLTFRGKQLDVTAHQLKAVRDVHDSVMQLLGGAHDQASYDAAKQRAASLYGQFGADTSAMKLPDQYSPQAIHGLQLQGMDTSKQLQAIARENRLNWDQYDDQADNERADTLAGSTISDRNARRGLMQQRVNIARNRAAGGGGGTKPAKSENALFTDIQRRFNAGEPVTDRERQFAHDYQQRHGGRVPQGRGRGGSSTTDGAIIRNPTTGQRMTLQGGKWVPIK